MVPLEVTVIAVPTAEVAMVGAAELEITLKVLVVGLILEDLVLVIVALWGTEVAVMVGKGSAVAVPPGMLGFEYPRRKAMYSSGRPAG